MALRTADWKQAGTVEYSTCPKCVGERICKQNLFQELGTRMTRHNVSEQQMTNDCEPEEQNRQDEREIDEIFSSSNHGVHKDAKLSH
jgi:positive regulator of sigma E activity